MRYHFVAPWRFGRKSAAESLAFDYLSRIEKSRNARLVFPSQQLSLSSDADQFLRNEIEKCADASTIVACLDENGKQFSSAELADWLLRVEVQGLQNVVFCIGGAYGLPAFLAERKDCTLISLSRLTLPHELALTVLLEQVYRARCILEGHPYHHGERSPLACCVGSSRRAK